MNIRPIREEDIEQVIQLFRLNYGDDYAIPEFYDPQWVKRGVYSDHIIWLVIEDVGRVVASGAAILDFGDYNDQIAEIGRLVVDPSAGGKGLGRTLLNALVDASDERVEFAFGEARTTHSKTQRIFERSGLAPLGFLPMAYAVAWRESWVLSGQLFGNGRSLRQVGAAQVIPQVAPIANLALSNLELNEQVQVRSEARPYPLDHDLHIEPLSGASLLRLIKIEQGRLLDPEVFGGLHIDQGISHLQGHKACYLVASDGHETLGAVGYIPVGGGNVRIVELIARDEVVKGSLLRRAVEEAEQVHAAEVIDCDVSANSPRIQRTLLELGFLPAAYVPGMVFHQTARWDVVRMMKLNLPWELGPLELIDSAQAMFDVVAPPFRQYAEERARRQPVCAAAVFQGLSALEMEMVLRAGEQVRLPAGAALPGDGLYIVLDGAVEAAGRSYACGQSLGELALLTRQPGAPLRALQDSSLFHLSLHNFDDLCARHPRLGVRLYGGLANKGDY